MALYELIIKKSAEKEIRSCHRNDIPRIINRIQKLATNPRPSGAERLKGKAYFRVRQGDYRIIYSINDDERKVRIISVGHRKEVYRS